MLTWYFSLIGVLLLFALPASADSVLDFPGAISTSIAGNNNVGQFVGSYSAADGNGHGFLYDGSQFIAIDYPQAISTSALAINDFGQIVGGYVDQNWNSHGFVFDGSKFTTFDYAGALSTDLESINNSGQLVGDFGNGSSFQGFFYNGVRFVLLVYPGADSSVLNAINSKGWILGNFVDAGSSNHAFIYDGSTFRGIDFPGALDTYGFGLNDQGQVVGVYEDATGAGHAFLYDGSGFSTWSIPGALYTIATSINNAGQVVGFFGDDSGQAHGFIHEPSKVKIVATVKTTSGAFQSPLPGMIPETYSVPPSVVGCSSYITTKAIQRAINIRCVDPNTQKDVDGCKYRVDVSVGPDDGGHSIQAHIGNRPFGALGVDFGTAGYYRLQPGGAEVRMQMPDVSGDIDLIVSGTGPNGERLDPVTTRLRVQTAGFTQIQVPGLEFVNITRHTSGDYGVPEMSVRLPDLVNNFVELASETVPQDQIPILKSEAGNLKWGGLFDYQGTWKAPHCSHRNGRVLDISLSVLNGNQDLKNALAAAIRRSKFVFYAPAESPSNPDADHWHISLK